MGNPQFAIVDEAYPYISKRLLTDESPRLRQALRYMIYGKADVFDVERLIDLLQVRACREHDLDLSPPGLRPTLPPPSPASLARALPLLCIRGCFFAFLVFFFYAWSIQLLVSPCLPSPGGSSRSDPSSPLFLLFFSGSRPIFRLFLAAPYLRSTSPYLCLTLTPATPCLVRSPAAPLVSCPAFARRWGDVRGSPALSASAGCHVGACALPPTAVLSIGALDRAASFAQHPPPSRGIASSSGAFPGSR